MSDKQKVVAIIGDGAMTGGLAFEGINNAGHENTQILVILNDFSKSRKFVDAYMRKMGYHRTTIKHRILYKIRHNESIRLVKVAVFLLKTYGIRFLLKK